MFGLSPIVLVVLIAAALQCATGLGWYITSNHLEKSQEATRRCNAEHQAFVNQTKYMAEQAKLKAKEIEAEQKRIADETVRDWSAAVSRVRADAAKRVRLATSGSSGGSGLSEAAKTGLTIADADPNPIPSSERVAADCAETTITANSLQGYIERIQGQQE